MDKLVEKHIDALDFIIKTITVEKEDLKDKVKEQEKEIALLKKKIEDLGKSNKAVEFIIKEAAKTPKYPRNPFGEDWPEYPPKSTPYPRYPDIWCYYSNKKEIKPNA